jgi:hypothetical protein
MNIFSKTFENLAEVDKKFLFCIANNASISLDDLYKILLLSDSRYVEWPYDDSEYPDINEGYGDKYDWVDDGPLRISKYGESVDREIVDEDIIGYVSDHEIRDGRLIGLTIDFTQTLIRDPLSLFSAVNFALNQFRDDLKLEGLCFCALMNDADVSLPEFEIRLPYLKCFKINRVKFSSIKFIAAPRLQFFGAIDSRVQCYDFSRTLALKEVCIGCGHLMKIILPLNNVVNRIIVGKGDSPTVKAMNNGIGVNINDFITNIGFSVEYLSAVGCDISQVDLSLCSDLKYLDLSGNPLNKLNLAWVPDLEYLKLEDTGVEKIDTSGLAKLK